ncbi:MAG: DUF5615 family PIN-like protein [Gemmataceae bacterium]
MAALYADENVSHVLVDLLRGLGHDVLTAQDDGRAGQGIADPDVLARATALGRAVLTNNRRHYHRLHALQPAHAGVVTYTSDDRDPPGLAGRIHVAVTAVPGLAGQCVRVLRPSRPPTP